MKQAYWFSIALVSAPDAEVARRLARAALEARLAACANLIPAIESHYWWQGKIEESKEVLILFKTPQANLNALEKLILELHPYDTPEFLVLTVDAGNERYLDWIAESCRKNIE